ncbi:phosphoribosylformylglycinamidine synthase subunit PurL [Corynebacterium auriscanis]|uniref:phosphoribosylformylglycinamidine synthase subunit PurL n=1 Tax=Corynebacterium auriscanis TaxID=99807 RepID=UPI003CE81BB3
MTENKIHNDTVAAAQANPDLEQPYAELGLKDDEYARIKQILGRRPTDAELAMYSIMWSEHCSYKSSKVHLRYFGETTTEEMKSKMLAGIGENAGVIDIGDGHAVTFKVESHNHPSYVEPYQGAATGVGGIIRDIMAMGARPVAVMDQLRFGPADAPDTQRVLPGVVAGVGGYGNSLGLPNLGGETVFDESYAGNPLVNALGVGTLKVDDLKLAFASGTDNRVILFGSRTGLDGIGGVSVLASDTFEEGAERKLPAVQVGDPFAEKVLIECCLDLYNAGIVVGIQDLGGAGLSCATSELASAGDGGMHVNLDNVHLRAEGMTAAEILSSESQERMMAVVKPENVDAFMEICRRWDVLASDIGYVTDQDNRLTIEHQGEIVVDAPPHSMAEEGPVYERPYERPADQDQLNQEPNLERPRTAMELRQVVLDLASSPALCSRAFITEQYDRYVRGNTVSAKDADAGVLRIDEETNRGIAVATDASGRYTKLDPRTGAQLALAEAHRNVAATGATPVAVSNCLNFGSPEDPGVMWQFREAVRGLADGCAELTTPVTGGNVSFYNQTGTTPILPTPVVAVLGTIDDASTRIPQQVTPRVAAAQGTDFDLVLVGKKTQDELGGSIWQQVAHDNALAGMPPQVDLADEQKLAELMSSLRGKVVAASDLSEGGLSQALVELAVQSDFGLVADPTAFLDAPTAGEGESGDSEQIAADLFVGLFSETASRILLVVERDKRDEVVAEAERIGLAAAHIGRTGTTDDVDQAVIVLAKGVVASEEKPTDVPQALVYNLDEIRSAWESTLPALFSQAAGNNSVIE